MSAPVATQNRLRWPRLPSGRLALDDDVFKQQALRFPVIRPIYELRATLGKLRLTGLAVGADGRNRFSIWPFSAKTGRNQPSTTECVFGPSKWLRGLIQPAGKLWRRLRRLRCAGNRDRRRAIRR